MFQEIITRAQAIERGLTRYFTGNPCKHGHIAERYLQSGCIECVCIAQAKARQGKAEKIRAIRAKHSQETAAKRPNQPSTIDDSTHQEIITRAEAIERGLKYYFTGNPCVHGHLVGRFASSGACLECERIKAAKWYQKNLGRAKATNAEYRKKNTEKTRARNARYLKENANKVREKSAKYYLKNKTKIDARGAEWQRKNPEMAAAKTARWQKKNKDKVCAIVARRHAAKRQRLPAWFSEFDHFVMTEAADLAKQRESATGRKWHVDHMIPLRAKEASGLHCAENLQVIPALMNISKNNRMRLTKPGEWIWHL